MIRSPSNEPDHAIFLAQTPPGETAEVFAPGIVNTGLFTRDIAMTPDGSEIYFGVGVGNYQQASILVTRLEAGEWTTPETASFSRDKRWSNSEPAISPDGLQFYFVSNRSRDGTDKPVAHSIWVMDREDNGWKEPRLLPPIINDGTAQFFPSVTDAGTLYFTRRLDSGREVIVRSRRVEGKYGEVEALPDEVNGGKGHFNAYVSPDESYLIVPTVGRSDSLGGTDYYISFRDENDQWKGPFNLGPRINTPTGDEWSPFVSPDGKYFFFMRGCNDAVEFLRTQVGDANKHLISDSDVNRLGLIWWIDASFIEDLRKSVN